MNKLETKTRALILRLLVEGNSIRATTRIADVSKNTVVKLLEDILHAVVKLANLVQPGHGTKHPFDVVSYLI